MEEMTAKEKIEESHGLWELAIVRLPTLAEAGAGRKILDAAIAEERKAFSTWQKVSDAATGA